MVIKEVKNLCFDLLKEKLAPLAYKENKKDQRFTKLNELGSDDIWFGTVEYKALKRHKLYIYISVRIDKIEELKSLYTQFYDASQGYKNPTCNINCGLFIDNPTLEFEIASPEDVKNAVETFWQIYNEHATEHIKKCYDINFLNTLYPKYANQCKDWFTISDWFISVPTVAYLANKETFPEFRKEYMTYLENEMKMPEDMLIEMNEYLDKIESK